MAEIEPAGLDFWMTRVSRQCDQVRRNFAPAPVHDLRVALRRCRSLADGLMTLDPHPAWKLMKDASRKLFGQLGDLRDTQVMIEWGQRLSPGQDEVALLLHAHLEVQEFRQKESAAKAVLGFDQKKWDAWARLLPGRARQVPLEGLVFQHLALERLAEVQQLHRQAIHNRSEAAYHRLRIGLKKFRYTVENFLPSRHERWGPSLRELQDLLGEMHDLYVLWRTAIAIKAMNTEKIRQEWRNRIQEERNRRLASYREKMLGKASLLLIWRSELPMKDDIRSAALARFRTWASFHDSDIPHSRHVTELSMQIYDGLKAQHLPGVDGLPDARRILEFAALGHSIGATQTVKKHHRASYRLIRKLPPLLGLTGDMLRQIALVVRFHRGSLPRFGQKAMSGVSEEEHRNLAVLSGILRLADAFDRVQKNRIDRLVLKREGDILFISAPGYCETDAAARKLAAARHMLEVACRMPVLIRQAD